MKKIVTYLCAVVLLGSIFQFNGVNIKADTAKMNRFKYTAKSSNDKIKLKWKQQNGVEYYQIYRIKFDNNKYNEKAPKASKYKKIAKTTNTFYVDKKAKYGVEYAYYIKGFSKKNKAIVTTYYKNNMETYAKGLTKPEILNAGYGEDYMNTTKSLHIAFNSFGLNPTGYLVYRKVQGEKKYQKIATVKNEYHYEDKNVKAGKTYQYKVKSYYKKANKTFYSKNSKVLKLVAVNFDGKYKVKVLPKLSEGTNVAFSLTSDQYNGKTIIKPCTAEYFYKTGLKEDAVPFKLTQYSFNQKDWITIPGKGVKLKAGKTIYLKGTVEFPANEAAVKFGDNSLGKSSMSFEDNDIQYYNNGGCYTMFSINFEKGTAIADQDWD